MKWTRILIFTILTLFFILILFQAELHHLKGEATIPEPFKKELIALATQALEYRDVPVGSILVFEGEIIGRGFNTVKRDSMVHGHAEVNALDDAMQNYGYKKFMSLDRRKLELYSTFEPCEMCMGTLRHYHVRHVYYMKEKSLWSAWKNGIRSFYYQLQLKKTQGGEIQDSLFNLHPEYPYRD